MMKSIILALLLFTLSVSGISSKPLQGFQLSGYIINSAGGEPLAYANLVIKGSNKGAAADEKGYFSLTGMKAGNYSLLVSYSGFQTEEISLTITRDTLVTIQLKETNYNINAIVVTGTRTERALKDVPVLTNIIDRKAIENIGTNNIQDALNFSMPNINFSKSAAGMNMQLAGLEAKYTVFLIDGEKISGEINGNIDYNRIRTSDIERIEIIKGASGLLYGSNAIGGVVNIITKKPKQNFEASIGSRYSRFNTLDLDATAAFSKKKFSSKSNFYFNHTDGFDMTLDSPYEMTQDAFTSKSFEQQFDYKVNDRLNVSYLIKYYDRERFDADLIPLHFKDYNLTSTLKSTLHFEENSSLYVVWNSDQYTTNTVEELFDNREKPSTINSRNNLRISGTFDKIKKNSLSGGLEFIDDKLFSDRIEGDEKSYQDYVLYLQDEYKICDFFTAIGGFRMNLHSVYDFHIIPQLTAMFTFSDLKIRGGYSMGYRSPGIKELYMNFTPVPVVQLIGNPNLIPETSNYVSLSAEYSKSFFNGSVSFYRNSIKDMITEVQSLEDPKIWRYENIDSVLVNGLDLILRAQINTHLAINCSYSFTDSEDKTSGSQMLGTSRNNAGLMLQYYFNRKNYNLGVNLKSNYFGEIPYQEMDDYTGEVTSKVYGNHFIWNLTTTHKIYKAYELSLGVHNLFNHYELENVMNLNPGRRFFVGLRVNIHHLSHKK